MQVEVDQSLPGDAILLGLLLKERDYVFVQTQGDGFGQALEKWISAMLELLEVEFVLHDQSVHAF